MNNLVLIFIGGGAGSLARYGITMAIKNIFKGYFPAATFFSNLFSCIILALFLTLAHNKLPGSSALKFLIITGFCGGFSTFSAFSYETVELMRSGNFFVASANVILNVVFCIAVIFFITKTH